MDIAEILDQIENLTRADLDKGIHFCEQNIAQIKVRRQAEIDAELRSIKKLRRIGTLLALPGSNGKAKKACDKPTPVFAPDADKLYLRIGHLLKTSGSQPLATIAAKLHEKPQACACSIGRHRELFDDENGKVALSKG